LKRLTQEELNKIIELHAKWLMDEKGGKKADLSDCDISNLKMKGANLVRANLEGATLVGATLVGANIDYTNLPLHCGIVGIKVDERIVRQWIGHIAAFEYIGEDSDIKELLSSNLFKRIAKASHRARECGLIED